MGYSISLEDKAIELVTDTTFYIMIYFQLGTAVIVNVNKIKRGDSHM